MKTHRGKQIQKAIYQRKYIEVDIQKRIHSDRYIEGDLSWEKDREK